MALGRRKSESPKQVLGAPALGGSTLVWSEFVSSSSVSRAPAEREVWKWGLGPFLSLEDDVKCKNVGSSGLRTTDLEGVMSSALLKPNLISGTTWLRDGDGLENADFSFPSSLTPFFVSGTDLGLKAVPKLSSKAGSSVVKELRGSPVSASGDTL